MSSATLPMRGKEVADLQPVLAVLLEPVLRTETDQRLALQLRDLLAFGEALRHPFAVQLGELRLIVEGLQVRWAAGLVEKDDALGLGCVMQRINGAVRALLVCH